MFYSFVRILTSGTLCIMFQYNFLTEQFSYFADDLAGADAAEIGGMRRKNSFARN